MKRKKMLSLLFSLIFAMAIFAGCSSGNTGSTNTGGNTADNGDTGDEVYPRITDNKDVYAQENDSVENLYVTILPDNTATMADVDSWTYETEEVKPELSVRFDYGTPAADTAGITPNAVLTQRGQSASVAALKSYKIKLSDSAEKWKGQKTLNLNKHPYDQTKIRNKLSFDLMKLFGNTFSLRTQFCRLYIRDLGKGNGYEDYGLFTHVEEPGKNYMEARGLDKQVYMYKAQYFQFGTYPDQLRNVDDPGYDKAQFESVLEIEGIEDHERLIRMLKDANDETRDIDDVIARHFDRDNYITWLAINILFSNTDTTSKNFLIMSPASSDRWYFMPWDFDDALGRYDQVGTMNSWFPQYALEGASNYWEVDFHRRFLMKPQNVSDLTAKIEELSRIASREVIAEKVSGYYSATRALVTSEPDMQVMETSAEDYEAEIKRLPSVLETAKQKYYAGLEKPMPFELYEVQTGPQFTYTWEASCDLKGEAIRYDFKLSRTMDFGKVLVEKSDLTGTSLVLDALPAGKYYWKVEAVDASGNRQVAYDSAYDEESEELYFGVRELIVE